MVGILVGIKNVEFTNEQTNQTVKGRRFYITYEDHSDNMLGKACDSKFFSDDSKVVMPKELIIGRPYEFVYEAQGLTGKATLVEIKALK